jgi:hypothetical protein
MTGLEHRMFGTECGVRARALHAGVQRGQPFGIGRLVVVDEGDIGADCGLDADVADDRDVAARIGEVADRRALPRQPGDQPLGQAIGMVVDNDDLERHALGDLRPQARSQRSLQQVNAVVAQHHDADGDRRVHPQTPVPRKTTTAVLARIWMSSHSDQRLM